MAIPERPTFPTVRDDLSIQVTDDGSRTLVNNLTGDTFHSSCGALTETRQVYLQNSGVTDRLALKQPTRVLEIGLGTTMAMLVTVDQAIRTGAELDYVAIESDLLSSEVIRPLDPHSWISDPTTAEAYLAFRDEADLTASRELAWHPSASHRVHIHVGDVHQTRLGALGKFDAVFFDPFAPNTDPSMWSLELLKDVAATMSTNAKLVTYCVKRTVRDALKEANFDVERVPGPVNGKREVLIATSASLASP